MKIPFNKPYVAGSELALVAEAVENGHLSSGGPFSKRCAELLRKQHGATSVVLTQSCTGALEMAAMLAGVGPGDEVVMPSFTFPSTANAFALRGGTPVFVDIREDTLNLDESLLADAVGERTKAIVPVHYAGVPCDLDRIAEIAADCGALMIEDAAHAYGSRRRGKAAGSVGALAALSFHETKNVTSGEGGALIVNEPALAEGAEVLQAKGTNREAYFRGEVEEYRWVGLGSSFAASDLAAAFLWGQLQRADDVRAARMSVWERYHESFAELEASGRVRRPVIPEGVEHNAHLYYLLLEDRADRDRLISRLADDEIQAVFHFMPLHSAPAGERFGRTAGELPVTDSTSDRLVRLPLWAGMADAEVERVIAGVAGAVSR